ncbi:unnamed protein product [Closterium sp. Yama58-4]|nr:unnamed protein product [Closterium sp. Yama58-4]
MEAAVGGAFFRGHPVRLNRAGFPRDALFAGHSGKVVRVTASAEQPSWRAKAAAAGAGTVTQAVVAESPTSAFSASPSLSAEPQRAAPVFNGAAPATANGTAPAGSDTVAAGRAVAIYDTTLRDGSQMVGITLSVADKLRIAELLEDLGVDYIEAGWPGSNPKDAEFFQRWKAREAAREGIDRLTAAGGDSNEGERRRTKLAAFGATRYKNTTCEKDANVQALVESGAPVITLVAKAWDAQVLKVLEATLEENLAMIDDTVRYFTAMGRHVMLDAEHFYDGFSANPEYSMQCVRAAARAGAKEIVLCDTNGGSMPWRVHEVTRLVVEELARGAVEGEWGSDAGVGVHCHNDCGMAVANSVEAVRAGARVVQGCINGYGERTGNADIVTAIGILQVKLGCECLPRDSLARLAEISAEIARVAGQPPNPAQPFVGANAFAHKGGIHVAALRKMPESYNHCDPSLVGNAMRSVVSDLSGRGNILEKAERAGLDLGREEAGQVLARIKQMEARGFAFENAAASVDMLIVRRGARYQIPAAEGNGPVDALNHALRASLDPHFPQLSQVELVDYRVRLLEPTERRSGTMSTTRVTIDFCDKSTGATWTTRRSGTMCAVRCSTVLGVVLVRWERRSGTMSTTRVTIDLCDKSFGATWTTRRSGTMSTTRATTDFCDKSSEATLTTAAAQCPPLGLPLSSVIRAQEPRGTMSPTQVPLISSPPPPPLLSPSLAALPPGGSTLIHRGGQFPRAHRRTGIRHRQLQRGTDL